MPKWLNERTIIKAYSGSTVYGTAVADSDVDIRGICIPPRGVLIGLNTFSEHRSKEPDCVIKSLHEWARLALKGNPNILELLWTDQQYWIMVKPHFLELVDIRQSFLSKRVKTTYLGYATSQLRRMTKLNKNANTNPRRQTDVQKYGFDCKNALHLIRLMRMCCEILADEGLIVSRPDAGDLLAIRHGEWSYDKIIKEANHLEECANDLFETTTLPDEPDFDLVNGTIINITMDVLKNGME